ncbi:sulfur carrier protein ThiS [Algicola sagamiensis]|uniref:sulfur carrier protein ThiS n=1 Tax=Algicola sagamiensis TaxID=163869 RepID=UPI0003A80794|nr:sulfur carrier protein ThiS [Algicola sagamiensis]
MNIWLNGKQFTISSSSLSALIKAQSFQPPFAVAINEVFLPQAKHATYQLKPDDVIDIVSPIQGG